MLNKLQNRKQEGFTIIEVLIVLAIAGLILLIVFLAVPNLQRSSRNSQRKTDVGRIGSAATTVISNNNGQAYATSAAFQTALQAELGTLSYYTAANVAGVNLASGGTQANPNDKDKVTVVYNGKCSTTTVGAAAFSQRQIAVLYSPEDGNNSVSQLCVDQ